MAASLERSQKETMIYHLHPKNLAKIGLVHPETFCLQGQLKKENVTSVKRKASHVACLAMPGGFTSCCFS